MLENGKSGAASDVAIYYVALGSLVVALFPSDK
jgi:hypothetical protein